MTERVSLLITAKSIKLITVIMYMNDADDYLPHSIREMQPSFVTFIAP